MATIDELIAKFEDGDIPTGADFAELIRKSFNIPYKPRKKDYVVSVPSNATTITVQTVEQLDVADFDLYLNNVLINDNDYTIATNSQVVEVTLKTSIPAARNGFLRVHTLEEVM